jgi:hypothetical protein
MRFSLVLAVATLFRRNGDTIFYRVTVPFPLRPYFRRVQVWRSLKTSHRDQATLRSARLTLHFQRLCLTLRKDGARMTPAEIDALIERWMAVELEKTEEIRDTFHFDDEQRDFMAGLLADRYEEAGRMDRNPIHVAPEADALLQAAGLPLLDHDTRAFKRLCRKLQLAKTNVLGIELERWQNIYDTTPHARSESSLTAILPTGAGLPLSLRTAPTTSVRPSPLLSEVVKKYLAEKPRAKRTAEPVRKEFEKFIKTIGGDRPIAEIAKTEGRTYKEDLLQVCKVILNTSAQRIHMVSGCCEWARKQGYVEDTWPNPMKGLAPNRKEFAKQATLIRPFTHAELVRVFSSQKFFTQRATRPDRYWVTLICLFQLCRREEAAQLAVKDIGEREGIPFISITDFGEDQSVKTPGSKRTMPIHSSLIALGFLEYVQSIRKKKHTRLFPTLTLCGHLYSGAIGKWFSQVLDRNGLTDKALVMHSLRHDIHYLRTLGCPSDVAEMLTGHTASSVHNQYEHRELTKLSRLQEGLEKLQFPEVLTALLEDQVCKIAHSA